MLTVLLCLEKEKKRKEKENKKVIGGEGDENGEENKREVV